MPDLSTCTIQDVIDNCGDAVALRQLLGGDTLDTAFIARAILAASGDVEVSAGNKFKLEYDPDPTKYPPVIRRWTGTLAARYCWVWRGRGQALPLLLKELAAEVLETLRRVEDGKKGVGQQRQPAARVAGYTTTDLTRGGTVPRMSMEGMRKGML